MHVYSLPKTVVGKNDAAAQKILLGFKLVSEGIDDAAPRSVTEYMNARYRYELVEPSCPFSYILISGTRPTQGMYRQLQTWAAPCSTRLTRPHAGRSPACMRFRDFTASAAIRELIWYCWLACSSGVAPTMLLCVRCVHELDQGIGLE